MCIACEKHIETCQHRFNVLINFVGGSLQGVYSVIELGILFALRLELISYLLEVLVYLRWNGVAVLMGL